MICTPYRVVSHRLKTSSMNKKLLLLYTFLLTTVSAFADYSYRGRPSDLYDDYDSSHGLWIAVFILVVLIVVGLGAAGKHAWENHKSSIKEGFGIVAFFGGCVLLFLAGKACSEQHPRDNGHASPVPQQVQSQQSIQDLQKQIQPQRQPQLHYRTEYYNETCPTCGGSRFIRCRYCDGKGYLKQTCQSCQGHGYREVYKVVSAEIDPATWQEKNPVYGYEKEYCTACFGQGYKEVKCNHCDNDYPYNTVMASGHICSTCNGTGVVERSKQVPYYE